MTTLPGGYCTRSDCETAGCPAGSTCFTLSAGGSACFRDCTAASECRASEGYTCDADNTCYPGNGPLPCSAQNPAGACDPGFVCQDGACQAFACVDTRFEPNNTAGAAAVMPMGDSNGLNLCANDRDWFALAVPPGRIAEAGITFQHNSGDLEFTAHQGNGACLGGRFEGWCDWSYRGYETGEEFVSVINQGTADKTFAWQVHGRSGAVNAYSLHARTVAYTDGTSCTPTYTTDDCIGRVASRPALLQFPHPDADDPYVGDGYRFDSASNYRWLRRELVMLVRHAIHQTQQQFAGTLPLGLIDMCQRDGITPGYDVGDPRHPESTHDQGGNVDIAYYTTLAGQGLAYNEARIICGPTENNEDGSFCTAAAATQHVVDLPRQVYFMAMLFENPRVRVIGADRVIGPLLQAEAERQFSLGMISSTARGRFTSRLAFGDGWPFHHHHIHVSMNWWDSAKPGSGPQDGCGFDLVARRRAGR